MKSYTVCFAPEEYNLRGMLPGYPYWTTNDIGIYERADWPRMVISGAGALLMEDFKSDNNPNTAGVLADWLEENPELVEAGKPNLLPELIEALRAIFHKGSVSAAGLR